LLDVAGAPAQRDRIQVNDRPSVDPQFSRRGFFQTIEHAQERRFARAGFADQRHGLAGCDLEVDRGERLDATGVGLGKDRVLRALRATVESSVPRSCEAPLTSIAAL
jgi:hypothetical protein